MSRKLIRIKVLQSYNFFDLALAEYILMQNELILFLTQVALLKIVSYPVFEDFFVSVISFSILLVL